MARAQTYEGALFYHRMVRAVAPIVTYHQRGNASILLRVDPEVVEEAKRRKRMIAQFIGE